MATHTRILSCAAELGVAKAQMGIARAGMRAVVGVYSPAAVAKADEVREPSTPSTLNDCAISIVMYSLMMCVLDEAEGGKRACTRSHRYNRGPVIHSGKADRHSYSQCVCVFREWQRRRWKLRRLS